MVAGGQARSGPADDVWPALDEVDLLDRSAAPGRRRRPCPEGRQDGELVALADGSVLYAGGGWAGSPTTTPNCPSVADMSFRYIP